jgi:hypothetical protein
MLDVPCYASSYQFLYEVAKHITFMVYVMLVPGIDPKVTFTYEVVVLVVTFIAFPEDQVSIWDMHTGGLPDPHVEEKLNSKYGLVAIPEVPVSTWISAAWSEPITTDPVAPIPIPPPVRETEPAVPLTILALFSCTESDPRFNVVPLSVRLEITTLPDPSNFVIVLDVRLPVAVTSSVPELLLKEDASTRLVPVPKRPLGPVMLGNPGLTRTVAAVPAEVVLETICPITHVPGAGYPDVTTRHWPAVEVDAITGSPSALDDIPSIMHSAWPATAI